MFLGNQANTSSSPFGNNTTAASGGAFGSSSTGGGIFGSSAQKPFGSSFGTPQNTNTSPFGATTQPGGAFGSAGDPNTNNGTAVKPFTPFSEKDTSGTNFYQSVSAMPDYKNFSVEELRLKDYEQGRRYGNGTAANTSGFGAPATSGFSFGANNNAANTNATSAFGASNNNAFGGTGSAFGASNNNTGSAFGSAFGANNTATNTGGIFGQSNTNSSPFGANNTASNAASGGFGSAFGSTNSAFGANKPSAFGSAFGGSTNTGFGATNNTNTGLSAFGGGFGSNSSPFGQNNNNSAATNAFGTTTNNNNNNNSSPFGGANNTSTNAGGLFGSNNNTGAFGSNNTNSAFGANTNNNASGGLFGLNSTFGKPAASGGLLGNNNNQSTAFGANTNNNTGGGLFGSASNTNNNTGGGLFGSNNQNNNSGGLFGANNNTQNNTSGGLFGSTAQNNNNNTGGGLFGAKPATGGLFGGSNSGNTGANTSFGATQNTGTSGGLFGSKPAGTTGGLFGSNNTATNTGSAGGLFGNNNAGQSTGGGLFGNNTQNTSTGTTGGLFGKPATNNLGQSGGLFGNNNATANTNTSANNGGGLFGGQPQQNGQQSIVNINALNPYGDNQLFNALTKSIQETGTVPTAVAVDSQRKKKVSLASAHKAAPLFGPSRVVTPPVSTPKFEIQPTINSTKQTPFTVEVDRAILSSDIFSPKSDFRKLVVNGSSEPSSSLIAYDAPKESPTRVSFDVAKKEIEPAVLESKPENEVDEDGYWTLPPLSELRKKSLGELRKIENFTIGRKHYGELRFLKPVDLSGFNLDEICGNIVEFSSRNVVVYPDDNQPKEGEGLNIPAEVTLEGCYPINKKTKLAILDPKDEIVKKHIEKLKSLKEMKFKNYDPNTGSWTFTFDHV